MVGISPGISGRIWAELKSSDLKIAAGRAPLEICPTTGPDVGLYLSRLPFDINTPLQSDLDKLAFP